jgi:hypothetical protein
MQKMLRETRQNFIRSAVYSVYHCEPNHWSENKLFVFVFVSKKIPAEPHQTNLYLFTGP